MTASGQPASPAPDRDLEAFRAAVEAPPERFSLFHAALLISSLEYPAQESGWDRPWHRRLGELIHDARTFLGDPPPLTPRVATKRLATYFCETAGFRGDIETFSAARNSCLTDVLLRRRGLPITLSVLLITMGRRLGLDMFGVGTPGHFITGARVGPGEIIFIDPFHGSELLSRDEVATRIATLVNVPAITPEYVHPFLVPERESRILHRMLNNLRGTYRAEGDLAKMLRLTEWLLALDPHNLAEIRNHGLLLLRQGRPSEGARQLLRYVETAPEDAEDLDIIREEALKVLGRQSIWN